MESGTRFQPVIPDTISNGSQTDRVILLSGKIYYDLAKEREALGLNDRVALIRLEELSPFPFAELKETLKAYADAKEFFWLQEEPRNQGAYTHVASRINHVLSALGHDAEIEYKGRKESAIPAPGVSKLYAVQQRGVISSAFA